MEIRPVGEVRSCFGGKFGVPRQPGLCPEAWGELHFTEEFRDPTCVRGLEGFSHLWLIFHFHLTADAGWRPSVRPPRLGGNERVGVFASRSTFRPNALGLSLVRLEGIEQRGGLGPVLQLSGIDLVDRTPVFDVKPYLPYAEVPPAAEVRGGFAGAPPPRLAVVADRCPEFAALGERTRQVIAGALSLDPRPPAGRSEPGRVHGVGLCGYEVKFSVESGSDGEGHGVCQVLAVRRVAAEESGAGLAEPRWLGGTVG